MGRERIGFIGLGVMGGPMAGHLAASGYPVTVFDLSAQAIDRVRAGHADIETAASPRAIAEAADIVITMLPSGREVRETALGSNGLIEGFKAGSLLLDTSSAEPWLTTESGGRLREIGVEMVDAPVSGAEAGAKAAELVFMVGGETDAVTRVKPLLDIMGKEWFHLGPLGAGHAMKCINNLITSVTFLATTEGLTIGKRYGLDPAVMIQVLNRSTGMSWVGQTHFAQRIFNRKFDDAFKFDLMMKDIDIALKVAGDLQLELPLIEKTQELWHEAQATLERGASVSELVRAVERKTGVELKS